MPSKQDFKALIAEGNLKQAIDGLLAATERNGQTDLHNNLVGLSGRFHRNEREKLASTISESGYNLQWGRITEALKVYLEAYREEDAPAARISRQEAAPPVTPPLRRPVVFISYSHADKTEAWRLWEDLKAAGYEVIIDRNGLLAGKDIRAFIAESVQKSDITLSVVSGSSLESAWVAMESMNAIWGTTLANKQFAGVMLDKEFFELSYVNDTLDEIEKEIAAVNAEIDRSTTKGRSILHLQDRYQRYLDLHHHLPTIVQRLTQSLSINLMPDNREKGLARLLESLEKMEIKETSHTAEQKRAGEKTGEGKIYNIGKIDNATFQ